MVFEGEHEIKLKQDIRTYQSEANSFDWTVVGQKPNWMLKANMPVTQNKPVVILYDDNEKKIADELKAGLEKLAAEVTQKSREQTVKALEELTAKAKADEQKLDAKLQTGLAKILADTLASVQAEQQKMKAELKNNPRGRR